MVNRVSALTYYRTIAAADENASPDEVGRESTPNDLKLPHGANLYPTALKLRKDLALDDWATIGSLLAKMHNGIQWALGDWWAFGHEAYGERKAVAKAKSIPYEFETLMNFGSVARRVPTSLRNEVLSFSHHYAIAGLDRVNQKKWLDRAARGKWSVKQLRRHMDEQKAVDIDSRSDQRAELWASYLTMQAQRARDVAAPMGYPFEDDARLDHLAMHSIDELIEVANASAVAWTHLTKVLKQNLQTRLTQGASFVPRRLDSNDVPRTSSQTYDCNGERL